ncbi:hypothetical protein DPMN_098067, partial [Dreissena polymorpha]
MAHKSRILRKLGIMHPVVVLVVMMVKVMVVMVVVMMVIKNSLRISGHSFMAIFLPASLQLMMVSRQLSKSHV